MQFYIIARNLSHLEISIQIAKSKLAIRVHNYDFDHYMSNYFSCAAPSRPPKNIRGYATGSTSAQLFWAAPEEQYRNGIITEYHVGITEVATSRAFGSYIVTNTQIGVASLHPYYEYNFTVAAYTNGKGPASNGLVIRTYQDGKSMGA